MVLKHRYFGPSYCRSLGACVDRQQAPHSHCCLVPSFQSAFFVVSTSLRPADLFGSPSTASLSQLSQTAAPCRNHPGQHKTASDPKEPRRLLRGKERYDHDDQADQSASNQERAYLLV